MTTTSELIKQLEQIQELANRYYSLGDDKLHRSIVTFKGGIVPVKEYQEALAAYETTAQGGLWRQLRKSILAISQQYLSRELNHDLIRDFVNPSVSLKSAMCQVGDEQCWLMISPEDQELLTALVALISMIDELAGWGPTFFYQLANLHFQAEEVGLDYENAIKQVAEISSDVPRGGPCDTSIQEFLLMFDPTHQPS